MKLKIFLSIFVVLLFSCRKESNLEVLLTDKTKKWVYIHNYTFNKNSHLSVYIKFDKPNICENYNIETNRILYPKGEWKYHEKDSSLIIFENNFKFLKIEGDSIYLKHLKGNYITLLMNVGNNKKY